jgi:hypothetical protein
MKLSEIKNILKEMETIAFQLPNGDLVPSHFHVTEVGKVTKNFIDCGGTVRNEEVVNFQLWQANDYDHRLHPEKLVNIIELSEEKLQIPDLEIEVEYQMKDTIGKFNLDFDGTHFLLISKLTDCLAKDNCGIPVEKPKVKIGEWISKENTCAPGSGCC